jgi:hypothetical protein
MKYGQKLKLGDAHFIPRNIQEVQASKLGDALRHPFFIGKNMSPFKTLYFYCFGSMHFSWSVFTFTYSFLLFCLLK